MNLHQVIVQEVKAGVSQLFEAELASVELQPTKKEFAGDITVVVFPMLRLVKGNPAVIGEKIGEILVSNLDQIESQNGKKRIPIRRKSFPQTYERSQAFGKIRL